MKTKVALRNYTVMTHTGCLTLLEILEMYWNYFSSWKSWKFAKSPGNFLAEFVCLLLL